jgi:ABC-2 type transport system permease protein
MSPFARQATLVFGRQVREATRDPGPFFVLPMLPALLMTVVFTALFDRVANVEGFSASSYDAFLIPGVVTLVALLGAGATSSSLAADVRSGYLERLRLLPISLASLLAGRFFLEAVRLLPGALVVVIVGFAFGGRAPNGIAGVAVVVALVALLGIAYSAIFYIVAIRTQDPQTPFTLQPLGLPLAFLSSALVPLAIMPAWGESVARLNPVTLVVDGAREAMLGDLASRELFTALAVLIAWITLGQFLAWRTLVSYARGS